MTFTIEYFETSAATGTNIAEMFQAIMTKSWKNMNEKKAAAEPPKPQGVVLTAANNT